MSKKLVDYQGEEALELWADLFEPLANILGDKEVAKVFRQGKNKLKIAQTILKTHKADITEILLRVDDAPINGLNLVFRVMGFLLELENAEEFQGFFGSSSAEKKQNASSGSATANTEAEEK